MKANNKISPTEDYWTTPPYSSPLNRIKSMMANLDKELSELYRKKSLEYATKNLDSNRINDSTKKSSSTAPLNPTINVKNLPSKTNNNHMNMGKPIGPGSSAISLHGTLPGSFTFERYKRYKNLALHAYQNRKIFTVYGYYPRIRQALQRRGWVEKLSPNSYKNLQSLSQHSLLKNARDGNDYELVCISKLLEKYPTYFIWQPKGFRDLFNYALPYRNRVRRSREFDFTTKEGLIGCINNSHYFSAEGVAEVHAPRTYNLAYKEDIVEFLIDFRITYCKSLINYITKFAKEKELFNSDTGTIPITYVYFAIDRLTEAIETKQNNDLDTPGDIRNFNGSEEWSSFMINANKIINEIEKIKTDSIEFTKVLNKCNEIQTRANLYWPSMEVDGYSNIWILKPAYYCRGSGIVMMRDYDAIVSFANKRAKMRYCVQKYIERPLLIYKTKFDIRQYILITISDFINIWIYRDCYLKFSSQEFNLKDLRECIHLTNNTVQKRYKNGIRSDKLPPHNMWHLSQFQSYLKSIQKDDIWNNKIFPGLKQNVISVLLASLDETDLIMNNFELYGCDFLIDETFTPHLIEINATPDMSASTCVTAKLCPAVLEDVIKVVIDLPKNLKASTGGFELIYKLPFTKVPSYASGLTVEGKGMKVWQQHDVETNLNNAYKTTKKVKPALKKKSFKIITEEDLLINDKGKEQNTDNNNNNNSNNNEKKIYQTIKSKPIFNKRKRAGQTNINHHHHHHHHRLHHHHHLQKSTAPIATVMVKVNRQQQQQQQQQNNNNNKSNTKMNRTSAYNSVKTSYNVLKKLNSLSGTDKVIKNQINYVMKNIVNSKTKKPEKTPRRSENNNNNNIAAVVATGKDKENSKLSPGVKELLALKAINSLNNSEQQQQILLEFLDIITKKMGDSELLKEQ